ncbi:unnamed protein product [Urochloa decumbens]|uniref:DUF4283 domain-containing protein n=1 Tax=Urochloa decumbens TaxID=240449 RepID=A0ABC8XNW7_9POAL
MSEKTPCSPAGGGVSIAGAGGECSTQPNPAMMASPHGTDLASGGPSRALSPSEALDLSFSSPKASPAAGRADAVESPKVSRPCCSRSRTEDRGVGTVRQRLKSVMVMGSYRDAVVRPAPATRQKQDVLSKTGSRRTMPVDQGTSAEAGGRSKSDDGFEAVKKPYWWRRERQGAGRRIEGGGERRVSAKQRLGPRIPSPPSELLLLLRSKAGSSQAAVPARTEVSGSVPHGDELKKEKDKRMDPFERPGEPYNRPDHVDVCAAWSPEIAAEVRRLELHALVGVQMDSRVGLTADQVHRDALRQLRIPDHFLKVKKLGQAAFLLFFDDPAVRTSVLGFRSFDVGNTSLHLMAWKREFGADSAKLRYKARLCFEGVPSHAWSCEAVAPLIRHPAFVDRICEQRFEEKEKQCLCVWVWAENLDGLAKSGTLQIAQPVTAPKDYPIQEEYMDVQFEREGPADSLKYDVLIHLDRVEDYHPLSHRPTHRSSDSDISGTPNDEPEIQWPVSHRYVWHLGHKDGELVERRISVHDRLGPRRRDGSPPGGGGDDGGRRRRMQVPPSGYAGYRQGGGSSSTGGAGSGFGMHGQQYWRRKVAVAKDLSEFAEQHGVVGEGFQEPVCPVLSSTRQCGKEGRVDSMVEEAALQPLCNQNEPPSADVEDFVEVEVPLIVLHEDPEHEGTASLATGCAISKNLVEDIRLQQLWDGAETQEPENVDALGPNIAEGAYDTGGLVMKNAVEGLMDKELAMWPAEPRVQLYAAPKGQKITRTTSTSIRDKRKMQTQTTMRGMKGVARFALPLRKALLANPMTRPKLAHMKKLRGAHADKGERANATSRSSLRMSLDDQATVLLMRKSGVLGVDEQLDTIDANLQEQFVIQLVEPLKDGVLGNMRETFAIKEGRPDVFGALEIDAHA